MQFVNENSPNVQYNYLMTYTPSLESLKEILMHSFKTSPFDKNKKVRYLRTYSTRTYKLIPAIHWS